MPLLVQRGANDKRDVQPMARYGALLVVAVHVLVGPS